MLRSIRARLAMWYTASFAVFVGVLAIASYWFLAYTSQERVDEFLAESGSTIASAVEFERNLGAADTVAMRTVVASMRLPDVAVYVVDELGGRTLSSYEGLRFRRTELRALERALADSLARAARRAPREPALATMVTAGQDVRLLTLPYRLGNRSIMIAVAQVMTARTGMLRDARWALGLGLPLALALASLGGWWMAGRALVPLDAMSRRAREISASRLHERLPVSSAGDELGRLADAFNGLLGRLEQSFEAQARFVADASHELRTPVAVISGETELALARADRPREELVEALRVIGDEGRRLRDIVGDLFLLARADAGEPMVRASALHLRDLVDDSVHAVRTLAAMRGVRVQVMGADEAPIVGDESLLRRAIDNLVVNAIKYSPDGGAVDVELSDAGRHWQVDVRDAGPGLAPETHNRLFERFFRTGDARAAVPAEGAGLGLAIARWVARAHQGDAVLAASTSAGSTFRLLIGKPPAATSVLRPAAADAPEPVRA